MKKKINLKATKADMKIIAEIGKRAEDMDYWEEKKVGKDVFDFYDYNGLLKEAQKRGLLKEAKNETK